MIKSFEKFSKLGNMRIELFSYKLQVLDERDKNLKSTFCQIPVQSQSLGQDANRYNYTYK